MKKPKPTVIAICVVMALVSAAQERSKQEPMTFALDCAGGDCTLLKGAPQTRGMRGGSVKLKPGESVGWHSTSANEEALVILKRERRCEHRGTSQGKYARLHPANDKAQRHEHGNPSP
jgi:hypothetical protein